MTLTQELAQALRACLEYIPGSEVRGWPPGHRLKREALDKTRAALARYDAEPPTSRGSEGEVVAWEYFDAGKWHRCSKGAVDAVEGSGLPIRALYAAPQPAQPSAEAFLSGLARKLPHTCDEIEWKACVRWVQQQWCEAAK